MTGLLHEKEFSRKAFLKGGGALIVSVSAVGSALGASANTPFAARTANDYQTATDPRQNWVDTWIAITADNKAIVSSGETEFSGTPTGLLIMAADELNMDMSQMVWAHPESWLNTVGGSAGSSGTTTSARPVRAAAAYARQQLNQMAATQLGVSVASLTVASGVASSGGKSVSWGSLIGGKNFNYVIPESTANFTPAGTPGTPSATVAKPVAQYNVVGRLALRIDIPAKVAGTYTYIHNVRLPGMVHGRRVRPRGQGAATSQNAYPLSVDKTSIADIPNVQIIQVNNWLGVVAPREYDAIQAAAQLKVVWKSDPKFATGSGDYWSWLRVAGDNDYHSKQAGATGTGTRYLTDTTVNGLNTSQALATAAKSVSATYKYHYNTYVEIGPCCALADIKTDANGSPVSGVVYGPAQNISSQSPSVQTTLAPFVKAGSAPLLAQNIRAIWYEGSGSYGTGQNGQAVEEAALLSFMVGKPVRIQWMRWDQTGWDAFGPPAMWDVTGGVDSNGNIVGMNWTTYGPAPTTMLDTTQELLGEVAWPSVPPVGGPSPSDTTAYNKGTWPRRVLAKTQPFYEGTLKTNFLRAPNAPQACWATEQIIDELAHAANMDPVAFRKQQIDATSLTGQRWLATIDAATIASGWKPKVSASNLQSGDVVTGRGIALGNNATNVAIVVDVEVNKKTGKLVAKHAWTAQNNGITISLEGVTSQMSGALIQGLSRAMWEQPTWNVERVTSVDWVTYPILRFKDAPTVTMINVHPNEYLTVTPGDTTQTVQAGNTAAFNAGWTLSGSGEPPTGPIGAAVANAFFDATGVRIRQTPMRPAAVRATLKAAGAA